MLELGSGVGTAGLLIAQCCQPSAYIFSDCSEVVLDTLRENIARNMQQENAAQQTLNNVSDCSSLVIPAETAAVHNHTRHSQDTKRSSECSGNVLSGACDNCSQETTESRENSDNVRCNVVKVQHMCTCSMSGTTQVHNHVTIHDEHISGISGPLHDDKLSNVVCQHSEHCSSLNGNDISTSVTLLHMDWTDSDLKELHTQPDVILAAGEVIRLLL